MGRADGPENVEFWKCVRYDHEADVITMPEGQAESWQVIELYRARGDCE